MNGLNSDIKPGLAICAKPTEMNQRCGINPDTAHGYVCKADNTAVSVYLEQLGNRYGWLDIVMTPESFGKNFKKSDRMANPGYTRSKHYGKKYPEDCFL